MFEAVRMAHLSVLITLLVICLAPGPVGADQRFWRGDSNADNAFDISDAINTLGYLFLGDP